MSIHQNGTRSSLLLVLSFTLLTLLPSAAALAAAVDVVHLKNGGVVRGTIVEQTFGESLKVQTRDGSMFVYGMDEIDRVSRERAEFGSPESGAYGGQRNPGVAFALSWLMPGAGQMYNGDTKKGAIQMALSVAGYAAFVAWFPDSEYIETTTYNYDYTLHGGYSVDTGNSTVSALGFIVGFGTHLWSMIDAPASASRLNRSQSFSLAEIPVGEEMALSISPLAPGSLQVEPTVSLSMNF